jgi:[acyl-carrier-protein] S-malonyltransferase
MAAVAGLTVAQVEALCTEAAAHGVVVVAAHNSAIQVVVSGERAAVEQLEAMARRSGALRVDALVTGGAFHSPLMRQAQSAMAARIAALPLRPPVIPLFSSVTGDVVSDVEAYRAALSRQITAPVLWAECSERAVALGARRFVEVGPGRVLSALVRRCGRPLEVHAVRDRPSYSRYLAASTLESRVAAGAQR